MRPAIRDLLRKAWNYCQWIIPTVTQLCVLIVLLLLVFAATFWWGHSRMFSKFYCYHDAAKLQARDETRRAEALTALQKLDEWVTSNGARQSNKVKFPLYDQATMGGQLCVGILTINRGMGASQRYLSQTLSALLTRIPIKYQDRVRITVFNMDKNAEAHEEANKTVSKFVKVERPVYPADLSPKVLSQFVFIKEAMDYVVAIRNLLSNPSCEYLLLLEDDTIAEANWFDHILEQIKKIPNRVKDRWLFAKLFSPFVTMHWFSKSHCHFYLSSMALGGALILYSLVSLLLGLLVAVIAPRLPRSRSLIDVAEQEAPSKTAFVEDENFWSRRLGEWSKPTAAQVVGLVTIAYVAWFFAGKATMYRFVRGIQEFPLDRSMVATLYPREPARLFADYLESEIRQHILLSDTHKFEPKDIQPIKFMKDYHRMHGTRYVELIVQPDMFQHIGFYSSFAHRPVYERRNLAISDNFPDDTRPIAFDPDFFLS